MTSETKSSSSDETERLAEALGRRLKGGEVIELVSDLGGGKTTFARGLAKGIGSTDHVSSPTFTISKVYKGKTLSMHHFDFYRLKVAGLIEHELIDYIGDNDSVLVVEWADVVKHVLPEERLTIHINNLGDNIRKLNYTYPESMEYLFL